MSNRRPLPDNVVLIGNTKTKSGQVKPYFSVTCLFCGNPRNITRHDHAVKFSAYRCKTCSNKDNHPQGEVKGIRVSWFNKFKFGAQYRSLDWEIEIEDIADLLTEQGGCCALSGLPISACGDLDAITASLDRIDNSKGYVAKNVQLVHKKVNMMRGSMPVKEFVSFCNLVANRVKW